MKLKRKDPISFKAQATAGVLAFDMFDVIGADWFGEGITATMVSEALKAQQDCSSIQLNINSPGGDLFEGVAICNLLKGCGKPVNVIVLGVAASAASLIAMAGDTITMCAGTQLMIHEAMAGCMGFAVDMRKMADTLEGVTDSVADLYAAKTGMDKKAILKLMADETWMSPEDAVRDGFATNINAERKSVKNSFDLSVFKNAPKPEIEAPAPVEEKPAESVTPDSEAKLSLFSKQFEINRRK
jgi:ATP-dependent protease ClpP protease subunit